MHGIILQSKIAQRKRLQFARTLHFVRKTRMNTIWEEIFSLPLHTARSIEEYPMLCGVINASGWFSGKSQYIVLLRGETLIRTQTKFSREALLQELATFKQGCIAHENEMVNYYACILFRNHSR